MLNFNKERKLDLICLGRAGIDLNCNEINRPIEETMTFTKTVGGSPANIAAGASKLGIAVGFIGRVANNGFGKYVIDYFNSINVDTSNIVYDDLGGVNGLALTEIKSPTDCGAIFYRDNVADLNLSPRDINEEYIKSSKAILISGTALAASPSREAVFLAIEYARKNDTLVFLDIDYRPYTWKSKEEVAIYYSLLCEKCDVIIGTREEHDVVEYLWNKENKDDKITANRWLNHNAKIVIIKHGENGSIAFTKKETIKGRVYHAADIKKTFGAGDAYASAFITSLLIGEDILQSMKNGAASASIVISRLNCSESMPSFQDIREYIKEYE